MNNLYFSIVVPAYNKEKYIRRTINSVLNQSYLKFELVIVDDGSTDRTLDIAKTFNDERIKIISEENGGPSFARNTGVKACRYDWVMFLDADDEMMHESLMKFASMINSYPDYKVFSANFFYENAGKRRLFSHGLKNGIVKNPFKGYMLGYMFSRTGTTVYRKEILDKIKFCPSLFRYEDMEFNLKIMSDYSIVQADEPVLIYNITDAGASKPRSNINQDFLGHLSLDDCKGWKALVMYSLYKIAAKEYPQDAEKLYQNFKKRRDLNFLTNFIEKISPYYCHLMKLLS